MHNLQLYRSELCQMCTVNVKAKSKGELPVTVAKQPQFPLTTLSHKERNAWFRNAKGTITVSGVMSLVTKHQDHHSTPNASIKWLKMLRLTDSTILFLRCI